MKKNHSQKRHKLTFQTDVEFSCIKLKNSSKVENRAFMGNKTSFDDRNSINNTTEIAIYW